MRLLATHDDTKRPSPPRAYDNRFACMEHTPSARNVFFAFSRLFRFYTPFSRQISFRPNALYDAPKRPINSAASRIFAPKRKNSRAQNQKKG